MRRLLPLAILLALPASAHAGTVSLGPPEDDYFSGPTVRFVAAPGEANHVTVTAAADHSVVIRDTGAPIVAKAPCTAAAAHSVRCLAPLSGDSGPIEAGAFSLGDRNDTIALRVSSKARWGALGVGGGAGGDTISLFRVGDVLNPKEGFSAIGAGGGAGRDAIVGSPGDDELEGGGDADTLAGGAGDDTLIGDGSGRRGDDVLRGGPGRDTVSYAARAVPVRVDLAAGRAGARGHEDRLSGIEGAIGGTAHDVLIGDTGPNELQGSDVLYGHRGPGDTLIGRGGDDMLDDFGGPSRLDGGPGDDTLFGVDARDRVRCESGVDSLRESTQVDAPRGARGVLVPAGCDRVVTQSYRYEAAHVRDGRLIVRVRGSRRCRVDLAVGAPGGRRYGRLSFRGGRRISVALNAAGRRAARRHAVARIVVEERCADIFDVWRIRL